VEMLSFFLLCKLNQRLDEQMADVGVFLFLGFFYQGFIIYCGFVYFTSFVKRSVRYPLLSRIFGFFIAWFVVN
jgi:hypothetical protein